MTNKVFLARLNEAANAKTSYMWGTYGQRITADLIDAKRDQYPNRYSAKRVEWLKNHIGEFGFDCVGLIKGILWGWTPSRKPSYKSNNVPDVTASGLIDKCVKADSLAAGRVVYKPGHIGIYIGDGKVIEATLNEQNDGVCITPYSSGGWTRIGILPWITADDQHDLKKVAIEVIRGKYGNGAARKVALRKAGYDPATIQRLVNSYLRGEWR